MDHIKGYLLLEDGAIFYGKFAGKSFETIGEVVFNTAMSGYQEVLFDPSYANQIVIMTSVHIGNTGFTNEDVESHRVWVNGFIARAFEQPSNWRSETPLVTYLDANNIPAFHHLDTRTIAKHLRDKGCQMGGIFPESRSVSIALEMIKSVPNMNGWNGTEIVSCKVPYTWQEGSKRMWLGRSTSTEKLNISGIVDRVNQPKQIGLMERTVGSTIEELEHYKVAVWDFGVKYNILRRLVDIGFNIKVFPVNSTIDEIMAYEPDGILLSNGPGDPSAVSSVIPKVAQLMGKLPIFGICLGHQIMALAMGGKTFKMKYGHRGINHPVGLDKQGRIYVTVHNHGFAVSDTPLPKGAVVSMRSLNDETIEGLDYPDFNAFSVQFHPEASPGPHDSSDLFTKFYESIRQNATKK